MGSFAAGAGTKALAYSGNVVPFNFGPLTLTGGTVTTSTPVIDATQTWNAAGVTFTGIKFNVTDTASAAGSLLMDLQVGGASRFKVDKNGSLTGPATFEIISSSSTRLLIGSTLIYYVDASEIRVPNFGITFCTGASAATTEFSLLRDAAHTLAQRSGTNAQTFRIYNTFTDASNYTLFSVSSDGGTFYVGQYNAGTGTSRALGFVVANAVRWSISTSGHWLAFADNAYDIGASGANRPRDMYLAGSLTSTNVSWSGNLSFTSRLVIFAPSDGVMRITNWAGNDFSRIQFGGTTSSFPALKRNSTALETRLADDSAYAPHAMQYLDITDGITAPGSATGRARIYVDTADGDLKIVFSDGTIKTIVVDT